MFILDSKQKQYANYFLLASLTCIMFKLLLIIVFIRDFIAFGLDIDVEQSTRLSSHMTSTNCEYLLSFFYLIIDDFESDYFLFILPTFEKNERLWFCFFWWFLFQNFTRDLILLLYLLIWIFNFGLS